MSEMAGNGAEIDTSFMNSVDFPVGEPVTQPGWMSALSLIQLVINLGVTVYIYMVATWGDE